MNPVAFLGSADDGSIYALGEGHDDGGSPIEVRVQTNPLAPGGADADCSFDRLYLTVTWSMAAILRCTPVLDGEALEDAAFTIELERTPDRVRRNAVFERTLRRSFKVQGIEAYKYVPRGTWFALRIDTVGGLGPGDLIIDEIVVEYEPLTPTKRLV